MKLVDEGIDRLAIARQRLLEPSGLDERDLTRALSEVFEHKVDYADLYFQYTRSEGWSLEEGIVKSGSFSIEQGVGVRAVAGEKTAFAYSDEINAGALLSAARATRSIARSGAGASRWPRPCRLARGATCSSRATPSPGWTPPPRSRCSSGSSAWPGRVIRGWYR
jgi:TldD protein